MNRSIINAGISRVLLSSGSLLALSLSHAAFAQSLPSTGGALPSVSRTGDIDPFGGDIDPFGGDIDPFHGDLDPFNGDLNPFTGDIDPFHGDIDPFTGDINPFKGDIDPFWGTTTPGAGNVLSGRPAWPTIGTYWKSASQNWQQLSQAAGSLNPADPASSQALATKLSGFLAQADATWGKAYTAATGKTFSAGFVAPLLAKYNVSTTDVASLAKLTGAQRNRLFLEWYDGLMAYSGGDRVDWWMSAVRWSPAITQQQGNGADTTIGLLDANARSNPDIANNIVWSGGYAAAVDGHGVSVASLMVGAHDGAGVMGLAPRAKLVAYNPFDATNTASWADVQAGVTALRAHGASIINASLGVAGWTLPQEWQGVMSAVQTQETGPAARTAPASTPVYVIAAGNSGTSQTQNLNWDFVKDPSFIVVGSVDPASNISTFSNRPGTACLLKNGVCTGDLLMNHFIVAPGELLLVSDGANGVTRASGTSFAAPLVSGAIALLHDRWPWLAKYPKETANIIFATAQDLGAPGVDPVYGVGMLDVLRSQSPISFDNLYFFQVKNGVSTSVTAPQLQANGLQSSWNADGVYFTLYERVGDTFRDFAVPMSSRLTGFMRNWAGRKEHFQNYLTNQFTDWIEGKNGFTDLNSYGVAMPNGLRLKMVATSPDTTSDRGPIVHSALTVELPGSHMAFTAGEGFGALVNGGVPGFARSADYDASGGGANPLLGLASGGAFMRAKTKFGLGSVSMGFTQNRIDFARSDLFSEAERRQLHALAPFQANAVNIHVDQPIGSRLAVAFDYARLREANSLLGVQSTLASDLIGGSTTNTFTVGIQFDLGNGLSLAATGTQGRTRSDRDQALTTAGAIVSSAYSMGIQKLGLVGRNDLISVKISQPLRVHSSTLNLTELLVTDRSSGDLGSVTQSFGIGGERSQYVAELQYGAAFAEGRGRVGLYGKGDLQAADGQSRAFVAGGQVSFQF